MFLNFNLFFLQCSVIDDTNIGYGDGLGKGQVGLASSVFIGFSLPAEREEPSIKEWILWLV